MLSKAAPRSPATTWREEDIESNFRLCGTFLSKTALTFPRVPVVGWESLGRANLSESTDFWAQSNCVLTTSGRAAIGLALEELGIGAGDVVLVPTYHCPVMVSPIVAAGAEPQFFPIRGDGTPNIGALEGQDLSRAKAVIAAHYFGIPRPLAETRKFCDVHGIPLIEDCAHSYFGQIDHRAVGATGDFAIASLSKFFAVAEGGYLASASRDLRGIGLRPQSWMAEVRMFSNAVELGALRGRFSPLNGVLKSVFATADRLRGKSGKQRDKSSEVIEIDPEIATPRYDADLAHRQPTSTTRFIVSRASRKRIADARRRNYMFLSEFLAELNGAHALTPVLPDHAVPYVFPLWVEEPERSYMTLRRAGVPIYRWDILWPEVPALTDDVGLEWSKHVFQIGCHQDLTESEIGEIAAIVKATVQRA